MIAIVDYGVGNLFSLSCSFKAIGADVKITSDEAEIKNAEKIVLPGVGAFGDAIKKLRDTKLDKVIIDEANSGKDIIGICLGMQLLFEKSFEFGEHIGLGLLKGEIIPMQENLPHDLKIPHIGWNALHFQKPSHLLTGINENDCVYFVHSFYASGCEDSLIASAEYGRQIPAIVQKDNVCGCQFHPEKSGNVGLSILSAFCEGKK